MPYIGLKNKRIVMIPSRGQKSEFQWDLARHLFRMVRGENYIAGQRHKNEVRTLLFTLATTYLISDNVFSDKSAKFLKNVFFLKREDIKKSIIEKSDDFVFLRKLFEINPNFNTAIFWKIDKEKKSKHLNNTFNSLKEWPNFYIVSVPKNQKYISQDVYNLVLPFMD